uniref:Uncharacterized protein n=1 Tax=Bos indicus x Bos taurus TaxID=30522 RepID=A0A4W2GDI4_BOBOX
MGHSERLLVYPLYQVQTDYREAMLRAVDQLNERSSEAHLYRLLELDPFPTLIVDQVEDRGARKPVNFRVKETVCPRSNLQPPEQCDFKENGVTLALHPLEQCFCNAVPTPELT